MVRPKTALFLLLACVTLAACDVTVHTGKNGFEGGGIRFEIPLEVSTADTSPGGISYESKRFTAETDGSSLWVNDKSYGSLKTGDVVDFYDWPKVKVNGQERTADAI